MIGERIARILRLHRLELRHPHERWGAASYPDKLVGDQIPLLARMMAVADVYDAVTSARAYRPAWSTEQARELITREAGSAFDPVETRAMLAGLEAEQEQVVEQSVVARRAALSAIVV